MANSTPRRTAKAAAPRPTPPAPEPVPAPSTGAMSEKRFSTWHVVGIVAAILAVVALAFGAGLTVGYTAARVSRPALAISSMMPGFANPDAPYGQMMPFGQMPYGQMPYGQMMPYFDQMHPPIGEAAYLGITFAPDADGAVVTEVIADSPAAVAGLRPGDVIQAVDGTELSQPNALRRLIRAHQPGDEISLAILRDGQEQSVIVILGTAPAP